MSLIITVLIALGLMSGFLYLVQPSMIFYPMVDLAETPAEWGLPYEDVYLVSDDGVRLHGWYIPHEQGEEVVLFFHGNAGNISHRGESIEIFNRLGLNVLIIDYRGYGNSEGRPGEQGFYHDARAAWDYLIEKRAFAADQVIVFGRSMGAAVATGLASKVSPEKLILESAFSSARDLAHRLMPVASRLTVMRYPLDSMQRIGDFHGRLLMLHSPDDEIVPYSLGKKLFAAANEPKRLVNLRGDHNYGFMLSQPGYERELARFIHHATD